MVWTFPGVPIRGRCPTRLQSPLHLSDEPATSHIELLYLCGIRHHQRHPGELDSRVARTGL